MTEENGSRFTPKRLAKAIGSATVLFYAITGGITGEYNPVRQRAALEEIRIEERAVRDLRGRIDTDGNSSLSQRELEEFETRTGLDLGIELSAPPNALYGLPIEKIREANRAYVESEQ